MKAYGLCDLGRCYAKTNKFDNAIIFLKKALSVVDINRESWACETSAQICRGLSHTYADHYINKSEGNKAIAYAQKSLQKLGLEDCLRKKNGDIQESGKNSGIFSRWCLAKAYNRVSEYDNAQKCADYYYYLYEKYFKNDDHITNRALVDIEYGYTLLRKGKLSFALDVLNRAINTKKKFNYNYYLFHAAISRTEVLIRLNKLDEAYLDFQYAISQKDNSADNYTRLLFCISLYHAFIIKYKQKDYKLSLRHFADFCNSIQKFCESFLDATAYNELLKVNVFEIIKKESLIKICLQNSLRIFSSIYGRDHPFVRDYVSKNLN